MKNIKILLIAFLLVTITNIVSSKSLDSLDGQEILNSIEKGMLQNSISLFSGYLTDNCYISLNNGTMGYYTTSQSYYIFENYFSQYKITELKYDDIDKSTQSVNASGSIKYQFNGSKNVCKIFVSLKNIAGQWYIFQIIIN
ncbi:MAG: DUF4783 domain-containing protein [bacterium]